jgi:hypothetical protein
LRFNVLKRKEFIYLKNWDMVLNLEGLPGLKIVAARRVCLKAPGMAWKLVKLTSWRLTGEGFDAVFIL